MAQDSFGAKILGSSAHVLFRESVKALIYYFQHGTAPKLSAANFSEDFLRPAATFVTLERGGSLRGCVGSLQAHRPLIGDIVHNSLAAAFSDKRFQPLSVPELDGLLISYSILGEPRKRDFKNEQALLDLLVPYEDGLIIEDGEHRSVYLPQVWEQIPDKTAFLKQLKLKAGLQADHWSDNFKAWTYSADKTTPMLFPKIKR